MSELEESAEICLDEDGNPEPDTELRDYENVPLKEDIHAYFEREVRPHVADAWIDESKTRVGYGDRRPKKYLPCRFFISSRFDRSESSSSWLISWWSVVISSSKLRRARSVGSPLMSSSTLCRIDAVFAQLKKLILVNLGRAGRVRRTHRAR
jgi:hypothetical protein